MATQTVTRWVDDIDGGEAVTTVTFGRDGRTWEIDLSEANLAEFDDAWAALKGYVESGRPVKPGKPVRPGRSAKAAPAKAAGALTNAAQNQAIRDWANAHGHSVAPRGRISAAVLEAFDKAH